MQVPPHCEPKKVVYFFKNHSDLSKEIQLEEQQRRHKTRLNSDLLFPFSMCLSRFLMMAGNGNSETGAETNTNGRVSPLLLRYFHGIDRPTIRQAHSYRDQNVRYRVLKWIALSISIFSVVGGSLGVGATLWALSNTTYIQVVRSSSAGVYLLTISMVLLLLTGIIGFIAVLRQNKSVMGSFIVLLFVSLILFLTGGIWTYRAATQTDQLSLQRVAQIVRSDYGKDSSKTTLLDIVQQSVLAIDFRCCGSSNFLSWMTSSYSLNLKQTNLSIGSEVGLTFTVPKSCCIEPANLDCQDHRHMASNTTSNKYIYTKGCVQKLQASNIPYGTYALCTSLTIALFLVVGLVVSFLLFQTFDYLDALS